MAFHNRRMAALETLSRNRKRQPFLIDDIESSILSEADNNVLGGALPGQLICLNPNVHEGKAELANATATHSEMNIGVLGKESNCFDEGKEVDTNPVVSSEENLPSVSSVNESSPDL